MEPPDPGTSVISICFDGGHFEHVELVWPLLKAAGIRGTFFVTAPALLRQPAAWREMASDGHEIASHSHYEVSTGGALPGWSLNAVQEDLVETDRAIYEIANMLARSFAYDGPNHTCEAGCYEGVIRNRYQAIRSTEAGRNLWAEVDLSQAKCFPWNEFGHKISEVLPGAGYWSVPVFDRFFAPEFGRAGDDLIALLDSIASRPNIIVEPFGEVAASIAQGRSQANHD